MPGRTRLYQRAGSPLIHGHSRLERAVLADQVVAYGVSLGVLYLLHGAVTLLEPEGLSFESTAAFSTWLGQPVLGVVAALPTAVVGTWIARAFGWRNPWIPGAALASVVAVAVVVVATGAL